MNRIRTMLTGAAVGAVLVTAVAPHAVALPNADPAKVCTGKKVTFVSIQKAGDKSVTDDMVNNGLKASAAQLGASTRYVEALDPSTYQSTLENAARAGSNVIVTAFPGMNKVIEAAAAKYPNVNFIQIYGDAAEPTLKNLRTTGFRFDEATYLAGLLSGKVTQTGVVGYEEGMFVPGQNANYNAFKLGVAAANPKVQVLPGEVGSFTDNAKAKQVVAALYAKGADITQNDGPSVGHIEAARDANKYAITGAPGLVSMAPANVMGVTFIYFGKAMFDQIKSACGAAFKGGHQVTGVAQGVTGLYIPESFIKSGNPEMVKRVQYAMANTVIPAQKKIVSGVLRIPVNNAAP